ncbi:MAG: hypothetical protein NZ730_13040, partial [Porticoccaceae bacterium]|nr:hypothetical protein [Porticoccaceae bacterium]
CGSRRILQRSKGGGLGGNGAGVTHVALVVSCPDHIGPCWFAASPASASATSGRPASSQPPAGPRFESLCTHQSFQGVRWIFEGVF